MTLISYGQISLVQRMSWMTDIIRSYNGKENRIAVIQSPRESWILSPAPDGEDARRELRLALHQDPASSWELPLRHESVQSQNDVTGSTITIDATYVDWLAIGQKVLVEGPPGYYEATISGWLGATATTAVALDTSAPAGSWLAGRTRLMPIVDVYLEDQESVRRSGATSATERVGAGDWDLRAVQKTFGTTFGTGASITTFDGYDVLTKKPSVIGNFEEQFRGDIRRFSYGAKTTQEWSLPYADIVRSHIIRASGAAERQYMKKFFYNRFGRQTSFLMPTWLPDFDIATQPTGTASIKITKNPGYATWFASAAHKHLQLLRTDGTVQYVKATAVTDNGDGTESITLTTAVASGVEYVSLMELCRLAEDDIELKHNGYQLWAEIHAQVVQR